MNITRLCNPAIIQPLTRHSQDLNIIESLCFLSSDWPQPSASLLWLADDDSWWHPWHVTIVSRALSSTWWWGTVVTSRSQSQTMNTRCPKKMRHFVWLKPCNVGHFSGTPCTPEEEVSWVGADKMLVIREQRRCCLDKWPIKVTLNL